MRHGDVVALYPVSGAAGLAKVRRECEALIEALPMDIGVGMSGWHAGLPAIASAYEEALDAADLAVVAGIRGRVVVLEEVLVDHMVRSSAHANRILAETLRPVIEYDRAHNASLLTTLRTYLETRLNLTRSAEILCVNPNTVSYRLRRIRELSGRDPRNGEDLLVLSLAVRLEELRGR
jgi:DNA-binding PucR family transcriptional regulator